MWNWQLPAELSLKIFPLLSSKDIEQCRLVCKHWGWYMDNLVKKPLSWLTAERVLHDVNIRPRYDLSMTREPGCYAMHPIVNVGNDFFIFERKANQRFASALHVVHKLDYIGSAKLEKQTIWLVPFDVLSVDLVFAAYFKPGSLGYRSASPEQREACFCTVEIFEMKTFIPLPWHVALSNVVAMCQKSNVIYHLCLLKDDSSTSGKCFKLFALNNLKWCELAATAVETLTRLVWEEEHTSRCGLNFIMCNPHLQVEGANAMWTCGKHSNRLFLADLVEGNVTTLELNVGTYSQYCPVNFKCPTVIFGGSILGIKVDIRPRGRPDPRIDFRFAKSCILNITTDQVLEECQENCNLQQACSEQFLVYLMEMKNPKHFNLKCIERNDYKIRRATFPYYPHGLNYDVRMVLEENLALLIVHIVSNEIRSSIRCSNHVFMFDLTQNDLNLGMRVFSLGLSHYPLAISVTSGLIMQDVGFIEMDQDTKWFRAIKMSSINENGFVYQAKGAREYEVGSEPIYLSNCRKGLWTRRGGYCFSKCIWCHQDASHHCQPLYTLVSLRMESSIFLAESNMLAVVGRDQNGDYSDALTETYRMNYRHSLGLCKGFVPNCDQIEPHQPEKYVPCKGDGKNCFHARWV